MSSSHRLHQRQFLHEANFGNSSLANQYASQGTDFRTRLIENDAKPRTGVVSSWRLGDELPTGTSQSSGTTSSVLSRVHELMNMAKATHTRSDLMAQDAAKKWRGSATPTIAPAEQSNGVGANLFSPTASTTAANVQAPPPPARETNTATPNEIPEQQQEEAMQVQTPETAPPPSLPTDTAIPGSTPPTAVHRDSRDVLQPPVDDGAQAAAEAEREERARAAIEEEMAAAERAVRLQQA